MHSTDVEIEAPFHDIDPMNIVWHGRYPKYFEVARCALLDTIDFNYDEMKATGYAWPIVDMRIKYIRPVTFKQKIRVLAEIAEWEHRLKIAYTIYDAASNERLSRGYTIQMAVDMSNGESCFETPEILRKKLGKL